MFIEVEGFIISEISYKESSKILNVFTKEYGIIGVMASGAKKIKSPLRSFAQKFTYGVFHLKYKEDKLSTLISVDVINSFKYIRSDLLAISYLSYIVDLTHQTYKESGSSLIYDLFINAILKLEEKLDPVVLSNILEIKYLKFLGVEFNLFTCSRCLNKNEIVTIDSNSLELICKNCLKNEFIVSEKIIKLLRMYDGVEIKSISNIIIDEEYKNFINRFLKNYYDNYTGLYLYSKNYLEKNEIFKTKKETI